MNTSHSVPLRHLPSSAILEARLVRYGRRHLGIVLEELLLREWYCLASSLHNILESGVVETQEGFNVGLPDVSRHAGIEEVVQIGSRGTVIC
ncbi:hypothetical protein E2C01_046818 [Portunus trituberculatus]|uniref:Uncharacterized protein n=1 Tax=Portunus trituberculatus TaxID=210409 RepID=A0A5B7G5S2_PORTR|nr:hypothetical protein [Portunus trituberculatus]